MPTLRPTTDVPDPAWPCPALEHGRPAREGGSFGDMTPTTEEWRGICQRCQMAISYGVAPFCDPHGVLGAQ
jgi:hypothetical protein